MQNQPDTIPVAAIQMASGPNVAANLSEAARLIAEAASGGARLVVLPENFALMGMSEADKLAVAEEDGRGPLQAFLSEQAARHRIWLVGGTIPVASEDPGRVFGASLLFNDLGEREARYDKIHLFDVQLPDEGESYHESETTAPGDRTVVVNTPFGRLGIAVCYDLRFPEQFRGMLDQGMELLALPAAFTAITGRAHWEALIRARAIENQIYLIAAAQGGFHVNGRETHGDSMVVDPWGHILDRLPKGTGVVSGPLSPEHLASIRRSFPTLSHRRTPGGR
ncbi:acyltransferase [Thioalkalivibrio denitrificans]|uniref:Acyltransferase n=1 Tax=Thioalkalivibrio denitrificans TaxID=108003 RepID=A0A1V3NM17_9GAMM|nr:carbon-nitrogen hydrolase family protein [Thioalkalivibrio denitrificans]OOG25892.1 acyltransferase [Thioalkalivibrio denitrificans]